MTNKTVKVDFNKDKEQDISDIELGKLVYERQKANEKKSFFKSSMFQNIVAAIVLIPIAFVFIKGLQSLSII
jgi:hypothetical protein